MERTEKDWLDWLMAVVPELVHQPIALKKQYPKEYRRIIQVVGNWMTVEDRLEWYRTGEYQPSEFLSEELKAMKCEVVSKQENSEPDVKSKRRRSGEKKNGPAVKLLSIRKIDKNFEMPAPNPRYARTKYSDIYKAKPYSAASMQSPKPRVKATTVKSETVKVETTAEKKSQTKRAFVSNAEIREFVLEAMKTLGEHPSWEEYRVYAKKHGGVGTTTLSRRGFGVSLWSEIAEEERTKLSKEVSEPLERSETIKSTNDSTQS